MAISNARLLSLDDAGVTFRYKDYADDQRSKKMTLPAHEFIRRFLQHVLPSGFVKIRHYGLLANRYREANLRICRALLLVLAVAALVVATTSAGAETAQPCPHCNGLIWLVVARTERPRISEVCRMPLPVLTRFDSS